MSQVVGKEGSGIVTTYLILTSAEWSRTVIVANDHVRIAGETTLEVRTYWRYEDQETVLLRGMHTYLSAGTDEQRTDIEGSATLVSGDPLLIQANHLLHHLCEELCAHLRHHNTTTGAL